MRSCTSMLSRSCTDPFDKLRSEFRPLDSMQSIFLTCLTFVQRKHCFLMGNWPWVVFGWFWLVVCAFQGCTALRYLNMDEAECCFLEAGIGFFPCRQILTGWNRPPVCDASSCKPLTCPERTSSRYWARPLRTAHNCNNSAFPEIYES